MFRARELPQAAPNYVSLILKRLDLPDGQIFRNVECRCRHTEIVLYRFLLYCQYIFVCKHRRRLKKFINVRKLYN